MPNFLLLVFIFNLFFGTASSQVPQSVYPQTYPQGTQYVDPTPTSTALGPTTSTVISEVPPPPPPPEDYRNFSQRLKDSMSEQKQKLTNFFMATMDSIIKRQRERWTWFNAEKAFLKSTQFQGPAFERLMNYLWNENFARQSFENELGMMAASVVNQSMINLKLEVDRAIDAANPEYQRGGNPKPQPLRSASEAIDYYSKNWTELWRREIERRDYEYMTIGYVVDPLPPGIWKSTAQKPHTLKEREETFTNTMFRTERRGDRTAMPNNMVWATRWTPPPQGGTRSPLPLMIQDLIGNDIRVIGTRLVDLPCHMGNPMVTIRLKPSPEARLPMTVTLEADGSWLGFDEPSTAGENGPKKTEYKNANGVNVPIQFTSRDQEIPIRISTFPDREKTEKKYKLKFSMTEHYWVQPPPPPKPPKKEEAKPIASKTGSDIVEIRGTAVYRGTGNGPQQIPPPPRPIETAQEVPPAPPVPAESASATARATGAAPTGVQDSVPAAPVIQEEPEPPLPPPEEHEAKSEWVIPVEVTPLGEEERLETNPIVKPILPLPWLEQPKGQMFSEEPYAIFKEPEKPTHPRPFTIVVDFTQDKSGHYEDEAVQRAARLAADDWSCLFQNMGHVPRAIGTETTLIYESPASSYPVTNVREFTDFLLYVTGSLEGERHAKGWSEHGNRTAQRNDNVWGFGPTSQLLRSGQVHVQGLGSKIETIRGSEDGFFINPDKTWYNFVYHTSKPIDEGSYDLHEEGHALGWYRTNSTVETWRAQKAIRDLRIQYYVGHDPKMEENAHFVDEVDPLSGRGPFGTWKGIMKQGNWLITMLDALAMARLGYPLRDLPQFRKLAVSIAEGIRAKQGIPFEFTFKAKDGIPNYMFRPIWGVLPKGVTIAAYTGKVHGTAEESGIFPLMVEVQDQTGESYFQATVLSVMGAQEPHT